METRPVIEKASEMIDVLGGQRVLAPRIGLEKSTIAVWKSRNRIPWPWRPTIKSLLEEDGFAVPDDFLIPQVENPYAPRRQ